VGWCRSSSCLAGSGARRQRGLDSSPADPRRGRTEGLSAPEFLDPLLDILMRALPKIYESLRTEDGTIVVDVRKEGNRSLSCASRPTCSKSSPLFDEQSSASYCIALRCRRRVG
jgi:hypothetical protein